ncbi:MAG: NlpC/P60 family protein [Patescibacteria group bacterium]
MSKANLIVVLGRSCIGASQFRLRAKIENAPKIVNCSSFIQYLFSKVGISLPRLAVQQREKGKEVISIEEAISGDLIFTTGLAISVRCDIQGDEVGHVGLFTEKNTIIHACNKGVLEVNPEEVFKERAFRGIRRML